MFNTRVPDGVLEFLSGFGLAGLYISFVLVIARLIRSGFAGLDRSVIFEDMPSVESLTNLIHAICTKLIALSPSLALPCGTRFAWHDIGG